MDQESRRDPEPKSRYRYRKDSTFLFQQVDLVLGLSRLDLYSRPRPVHRTDNQLVLIHFSRCPPMFHFNVFITSPGTTKSGTQDGIVETFGASRGQGKVRHGYLDPNLETVNRSKSTFYRFYSKSRVVERSSRSSSMYSLALNLRH